jgi:hypothetical protein
MPKITEDEWDDKFGWSPDVAGDCNLLENTGLIRRLLARIGEQFVWSQQDGEGGGYEIVPGMSRGAIGYYLCDRPRSPEDADTVVIIPPTDC